MIIEYKWDFSMNKYELKERDILLKQMTNITKIKNDIDSYSKLALTALIIFSIIFVSLTRLSIQIKPGQGIISTFYDH